MVLFGEAVSTRKGNAPLLVGEVVPSGELRVPQDAAALRARRVHYIWCSSERQYLRVRGTHRSWSETSSPLESCVSLRMPLLFALSMSARALSSSDSPGSTGLCALAAFCQGGPHTHNEEQQQ
jgi:hypothetical protein